MTTVLIADDHAVVRYGTSLIVRSIIPGSEVHEAENFNQLIQLLEKKDYSLVILDINIPGGNTHQMIDAIRLRRPGIKILIFSAYDENQYAWRYLQAGADGYLYKEAPETEIKQAIATVLRNEKYTSESFKQWILEHLQGPNASPPNPLHQLSNREMEVLQFLVQGSSTAAIAARLHLQLSTVSTYKNRLFEKLEVNNLVELIEKVRLYNSGPGQRTLK